MFPDSKIASSPCTTATECVSEHCTVYQVRGICCLISAGNETRIRPVFPCWSEAHLCPKINNTLKESKVILAVAWDQETPFFQNLHLFFPTQKPFICSQHTGLVWQQQTLKVHKHRFPSFSIARNEVLDLPEGQRGCLSLSESLRLCQELRSDLGKSQWLFSLTVASWRLKGRVFVCLQMFQRTLV